MTGYKFVAVLNKKVEPGKIMNALALAKNVHFASFTSTMTIGTWEDQMARQKEIPESELEYWGICLFGPQEVLSELTRKFSLWI